MEFNVLDSLNTQLIRPVSEELRFKPFIFGSSQLAMVLTPKPVKNETEAIYYIL